MEDTKLFVGNVFYIKHGGKYSYHWDLNGFTNIDKAKN